MKGMQLFESKAREYANSSQTGFDKLLDQANFEGLYQFFDDTRDDVYERIKMLEDFKQYKQYESLSRSLQEYRLKYSMMARSGQLNMN